MSEIQKADPKARKRAVWTVIAALFIGVPVIYLLDANQHTFQQWLINHPADITQKINWLVITVFLAVTLPTWAFALFIWHSGGKVVKAARFPLVESRLVKDTPVITGAAARRRGKIMQVVAAVLVLTAGALPVLLMQLVRAFQ